MTKMLYVVSREQPQLYEYLRRHCEKELEAEVVYDRRVGERRRSSAGRGEERRATDRRQESIDKHLGDLGWALVPR